ncbi:Rab3-GTPase_cat domain-containing protein [Cephalotus follicularis]|uniref:Rab3-GTPase_cat domain-containing protein n=1 Tax=Cephalotus follicularis TaxID=3775 RepID=A0A1Q3BYE1_CEPFO|nr:Rab3-GTPase_cat domain-containing protein [Cephalotus follicularis]
MEAPSFVSKARTAFHSAAAKAERVFTDIKSDLKSDRDFDWRKQLDDQSPDSDKESTVHNEVKHHSRWRPAHIGTKQDWQDRFKNIRIGRKGVEDQDKVENSAMAVPVYDENLYILNMKNDLEAKGFEVISLLDDSYATDINKIPPTSVLKHLAIAVDAGKKIKSMKDLLASSGGSSPARERAGLSLSAVKSLVLRDKEDKLDSKFGGDPKVVALMQRLFDSEGNFLRRKIDTASEFYTMFPRDIHGAPPKSFIIKLSEVIGSLKTLQKMALFWCKVVTELRRLWFEEKHLPGIPPDEIPDLNSCLLYQQLQVINCCLSRKRRRAVATESLDSVMRKASSNVEEPAVSKGVAPTGPLLFARIRTGELVLRLGADCPTNSLTMLETGEPVYSPITQEGPLLTEDLIKETEELVLRTGSMGAGCSQLLSDMQAFKAANPGCILEDFVRWHSPPDWTESEPHNEANKSLDGGDSLSIRGQLSTRMQKEGNLWRELWETAKPLPAVRQTPLFDEDLVVEGILNFLEDIAPSELFEQLFVSILGLGFVVAEATLSTDDNLSKLFSECKDFAVATFQGSMWSEKVDDLCQVYETVETMLRHPEEAIKTMKQTGETTTGGETKRRFLRLGLSFGGKDRQLRKPTVTEQKNSEVNPTRQTFSSFFDSKSSLFSKKPPKPDSASEAGQPPFLDENDWTIV